MVWLFVVIAVKNLLLVQNFVLNVEHRSQKPMKQLEKRYLAEKYISVLLAEKFCRV